MADEQVRVDYKIDADEVKAATASMKDMKAASEGAADSAEKVEGATKKAGKGTADFGRSALETGRVVQDFAQGGIGGIVNNLEGLARALGGGPGLAGVLTLVGVGFLLLKKPMGDFLASMTDGGREIPKSTDAVKRLAGALKETGEKLEALEKAWDGSAESLAEYNRLTAESERLEKQANAAREAAAGIEAQRRKERQGDAGSMKAASEAVEKAGGVDKVIDDLTAARPGATNAARAQLEQARKDRDEAMAAAPQGAQFSLQRSLVKSEQDAKVRAAEAAVTEARRAAREAAADLAGKALGGDQAALTQMDRSLPGKGFGDATAAALAVRKEAEKAIGETVKGAIEGAVGWARGRQEEFKDDKVQAEAEKFREAQDLEQRNREEQLRIDIAENDRKAAEQAPARERQALQERARNVATGREGRERAQLQQFAAAQGVDIPGDQLGPVLDSMRGFTAAGAAPMEAALGAVRAFVQANQATLDRLQAMEREFQMLGGYAQQQFMRARQGRQINGSILSRGGG